MKTKNELYIFQTCNIEMLKSLYSKSKAYITDKISWENEISLITDSFRQVKNGGNVAKLQLDIENELKIFNTVSIEILKSLYYNSVGPIFNKQSWEMEVTNLKETFWQYENLLYTKKSFLHMGKELKIFNKPSIDALKYLYNKSIGYVLKKESWKFEAPLLSKTIRILNKTHRTEKVLNKIGNELRIFNAPSIENLKVLYTRTNKFLDGSQQNCEQPSSI
jgi:hypothetical protein